MWLTQIQYALNTPAVRRMTADCYELHRTIMSGFPDVIGGARQEFNVLHRLKVEGMNTVLLIQSNEPFNMDEVVAKQKFGQAVRIHAKRIDLVTDGFMKGKVFGFNLIASPTVKRSCESKHSKRHFLRTDDEQADWLKRKAKQQGFELIEKSLSMKPAMNHYGRKKSIQFSAVEFSGALRVVDEEQFKSAFMEGIGSEKAFGCGLLMIRKG